MALLGLICGLLFWLSIASMIISSACKLVGVRAPAFFEGMGIAFVVWLANFFALLGAAMLLGVLTGTGVVLGFGSPQEIQAMLTPEVTVFYLVLTPVVSASVFSVMLEDCSFTRGLAVWLAQFVVIILFILIIFFLAVMLGLARMPRVG